MFENVFDTISKDWMLITAGNKNKVNSMTASWGGMSFIWGKKSAFIFVRPQRYTKEFIDNNECFSLSFFEEKYKKELTYFGSVSGRNEDKIKNSNLHVEFRDNIPYFKEASHILICRKMYKQDMEERCFIDKDIITKFYPEKDYHILYIAEITEEIHI